MTTLTIETTYKLPKTSFANWDELSDFVYLVDTARGKERTQDQKESEYDDFTSKEAFLKDLRSRMSHADS